MLHTPTFALVKCSHSLRSGSPCSSPTTAWVSTSRGSLRAGQTQFAARATMEYQTNTACTHRGDVNAHCRNREGGRQRA